VEEERGKGEGGEKKALTRLSGNAPFFLGEERKGGKGKGSCTTICVSGREKKGKKRRLSRSAPRKKKIKKPLNASLGEIPLFPFRAEKRKKKGKRGGKRKAVGPRLGFPLGYLAGSRRKKERKEGRGATLTPLRRRKRKKGKTALLLSHRLA